MTTKGDIITGSLSPMHSKFASTEALSTKNSNAQYKRSPNVLTSLTSNKSNSFFTNPPPQDSNALFSANQHHTTSSNTNSRENPTKSLAIDTSEEASKYNNTQNTHFGSYSTTHNNAGSYNFSRGALASSFSGNLTTKFGSRGADTYKPSIMPSSGKSLSTSKLLLGSANGFPYQSSTQALKDSTAAVVNTENLGHTAPSPQTHYKNPSAKYYPVESNKSSSSVEAKSPGFGHSKNSYSSHQQENQQPGNENAPANSQNSTYHNESIAKAPSNNTTSASTKKLSTPIPNHEPTKCSVKRNGIVKAYAANTNQGIVRNYNEDRVSIILNIMKPASRANEDWPKCSFFGVYDGHGGVTCADFLRDNLHQFVIKEPSFPWNPKEALMKGFEAAEKQFLEIAESNPSGEVDRSGSCAIVVLIIGDMCYVANVGDSRAVMSGDGGSKIFPLSRDHKPSEENEQKRITEAGGKIYQTQAPALRQSSDGNNPNKPQMQFLLGPHRVFPGRLSVSRTFGDIEAKLPKYGGNINVVIPIPEIKAFKIAPEHDYIILASDGIYDKMSSRDVIKSVWESTQEHASNIHHQCGLGVENILREAINRRTLDNVTVVMICFKNFKYKLFPRDKTKKASDENVVVSRKELEQTRSIPSVSKSTHTFSSLTSAAARSNSSHNSKEKLVDQENNYEHNFMKAHHSRKNAAPLLESNIDHNVEPKRYPVSEKEKGEMPLSDTGSLNKKPVAKRGGGSVALTNDTQTQKLEPSHRYMHSSNSGTFRSVDYKNGEMFRFRNYSENK